MTVSGLDTGRSAVSERRDARKRKLYESLRERESYAYYESVLAYANTEPKYCDLHSPEIVAEHQAVVSADATLTALAQLVALRTGVRRTLISFLDAEYSYIIAESTRTLSLQDDDDDDSKHDLNDSLWLGFTKIPRGSAVWEGTADLPLNEGSNAQDPHSASIAHIVNDLSEDSRFCDKPYVKDGPKARFYAGVPITTPRGIVIGVLCVLDDKPREGLEPSQVAFLQSMASTVMSHLELVSSIVHSLFRSEVQTNIDGQVRAKEENQRSKDMNTALAAFVEGKSKSGDWWHREQDDQGAKKTADTPDRQLRAQEVNDRLPSLSQVPSALTENTDSAGYFDANHRQALVSGDGEPPADPSFNPLMANDDHPHPEPEEVLRPSLESREVSMESAGTLSPIPVQPKAEFLTNDLANKIRATAARAAGLIQRGVGADGVLFLDATVGSAGSLIDSTQGLSTTETETDVSKASDFSTKQPRRSQSQDRDTTKTKLTFDSAKNSVILGSAFSTGLEDRVRSAIEQAKFSEKVLKSLLRRYTNGAVWHFNAEGDASDEDDNTQDDEQHGFTTDGCESGSSEVESATAPTPTAKRASKRARTRKRDGRVIQSIFPGIRSLVFLGMWDPHQERWFGASITVSYSSMRIFSIQNELSYIAAFCDVVLAEIWRLEAQELGRSKNAFVSSISHELRSPLVCFNFHLQQFRFGFFPVRTHGILGSAECLEEQEHSALSAELIRSITACGNTLLDVVNDLLEYSRLNHGTQYRRKLQKVGLPNINSDTSVTPSEPSVVDGPDLESGFMINVLTEDAVNTACLGFDHQSLQSKTSSSEINNSHSTTMILNIEDATSSDWMFSVASGSWKRICINLISNALKYTPSGYINVTLRKRPLQRKPGKEHGALVEFIVEDSGIGMSDEFQVKSLFRPFRQENTLTPGTGLGLNLVAQMVKKQGGTVHVRSNKGQGTTVKVSLPLHSLPATPTAKSRTSSLDLTSPPASVGFFGFGDLEIDAEPVKAKANRRLLNSIKRYCMELGLPVYAVNDNIDSTATVHIIAEQALRRSSQTNEKDLRRSLLSADSLLKPMIIVCTTRASALKLQSGALGRILPDSAQYLWLPIGPAKLSAALTTCPGVLKTSGSHGVAAADPTPNLGHHTEEESGRAEPSLSRDISLSSGDDDKGKDIARPVLPPHVFSDENQLQVQRSSPRRSGSEVSDKAPVSVLPIIRAQVTRASTAASASTEAFSLLLVDDNAINLRLLEVFAKKGGHTYRTAQNGQEAVDVYEQAAKQERSEDGDVQSKLAIKPEVVLMDINMPVMNGFEAAREIRRFEIANGCPRAMIVAVTGLGDASAQEEAVASGMDLFLIKPVKMKEMTAMLAKIRAAETSPMAL